VRIARLLAAHAHPHSHRLEATMYSLKLLASPCAALLLAACAVAPAPEYARDHPANPAAPAAPVATQPSALTTYRATERATAPGSATVPSSQQPSTAPADPAKEDAHAGHH